YWILSPARLPIPPRRLIGSKKLAISATIASPEVTRKHKIDAKPNEFDKTGLSGEGSCSNPKNSLSE
ncbi:MAG: hypothetical protein WCH43_09040, partial [Verrucomicrobiota bacterium]